MVEWVRDSFIGIHACTGGDRIRGARSPWEKESVWQVNVERSRMIRELNVRHRQRRSRVLWIDIKLGCLGELPYSEKFSRENIFTNFADRF